MARVTLRTTALVRTARTAFRATARDLDAAYRGQFEQSKWGWPRRTKRQNGEEVGSPRDIVDSGALRDSQALSFPDADTARYAWKARYAAYVFLGATLRNGTSLPARNVPRVGLREFNFPQKFVAKWREVAR